MPLRAALHSRSPRSLCPIRTPYARGDPTRTSADAVRGMPRCKSFRYLLTDPRQFDILRVGLGWQGPNAIRSIETARVHLSSRRRGCRVAAQRAGAAAGDAGNRASRNEIAHDLGPAAQISPGSQRHRLCRGRKRDDRLRLGRKFRSTIGTGGRTDPPTGCGDRHADHAGGACGQSRDHDHPDRLRHRLRPVASGLVASLARPGGNLTGVNFFNNELAGKQLELLRELVPGATHVSALINPSNVRNASAALADLETAARARGMQIQVLNASTSREIDDAFATLLRQRPDVLFVSGDGLFTSRRVQLVLLATLHKVPAAFANREFAEIGGLMSYGANVPVVQASKFELVINAQAAKILGLTIPPTLLARADEVIE